MVHRTALAGGTAPDSSSQKLIPTHAHGQSTPASSLSASASASVSTGTCSTYRARTPSSADSANNAHYISHSLSHAHAFNPNVERGVPASPYAPYPDNVYAHRASSSCSLPYAMGAAPTQATSALSQGHGSSSSPFAPSSASASALAFASRRPLPPRTRWSVYPLDSPMGHIQGKDPRKYKGVKGHVVRDIEGNVLYVSREPWTLPWPGVWKVDLHEKGLEGPAILHSSKTPLKKWQYNISRARSSAITGSPAPNSLPWTGLLQKSDFFGQRWTFEVPSRPSSNGRAHPRGLATLANRDMGVCPGGGAGFGAGFGVGETGADYGRMTLDAIGTTGGDLTYEWTGATEMKLTAKGTGSDRPIAMFMRDIKVEKGAGELIFDADFPDVDILVLSLLTLFEWYLQRGPTATGPDH